MDINTEITAIESASRGQEVRQSIIDVLNKLNSGVLPSVSTSDSGKILKVNSSGQWELGTKDGYMPIPTETIQITENGTVDVTNYASVDVRVSGGGGSGVIMPLSVSENGTYNPPSGVDGYAPVVVNVPSIKSISPDYEGLSYGFNSANGGFNSWTTKTNYMSFFNVKANTKYCFFAANDNADRFRAVFFKGKTLEDFVPYVENSGNNVEVYKGTYISISDTSTSSTLEEKQRVFFTPNVDGELVILTSASSSSVPIYMFEISQL